MGKQIPTSLQWLDVRLGEDLNWWLAHTSEEAGQEMELCGLLDPRQVAHLSEIMATYEPHGLPREHWLAAFQMFEAESEIAEGRLRLAPSNTEFGETGVELFALPVLGEEGEGPYYELLDALSAARIRQLNATHQYARPCTTEEMEQELDAIDSDRYFTDEVIHPFDEINEILEWQPAEWEG